MRKAFYGVSGKRLATARSFNQQEVVAMAVAVVAVAAAVQ